MFDLKALICLVSVNFFKNEKYVLSTSNEKIIFPILKIDNIDDIEFSIRDQISKYFIDPVKQDYLNRIRFISFNDKKIKNIFSDAKNIIHIHYGGTVPNLNTSPDYYWFPFDYMNLNIQKELPIINTTIQHVI